MPTDPNPTVNPDPQLSAASTPAAPAASAAPGTSDAPLPIAPNSGDPNLTQMKQPAAPTPHGTLGDIFQTLAGGQKTVWRQTSAGPVADKQDLAPGEMARSILAAAITGLASGYAPDARGKGPGGALSAGFKGNEERVDQQAKQAQDQAQEQFKNKQVADELTMRKMQNAREQQKSIQEAQEHDLRMRQMQQNLEQGKTEGAEHVVEFQQRQVDRMNLLTQTGVKPLSYPDGKPVEEFNSPAEAMEWANKNSALAIQPGKYNTIVEVDPHTNRYMIMQKPLSWDDPQWLGVKTKDGVPVKDKNGDFIPDGSFKDMNGKVVAPAGQMTPHQMYDSQVRLLEMQDKKLSLQEAVERLKTARMAREKDQQQMNADKEFDAAQGNPDAIDPKTHDFIVSPSSRTILQQRFIKDGSMQEVIRKGAQDELEKMDPNDPNYQTVRDTLDEANRNLHQIQVNMMMLSRTPNIADVLSSNLRQQYTKPDGTYDEASALKDLDSMQMNSGVKQAARQKLTAVTPDVLSSPDNFNKAIAHAQDQIKQGQSLDTIIGQINQTRAFSQNDKQKLIAELTKKQESGSQSADTTPPVGGSVEAVKAIAGGIKNAITNPGEPPEPVAAQ